MVGHEALLGSHNLISSSPGPWLCSLTSSAVSPRRPSLEGMCAMEMSVSWRMGRARRARRGKASGSPCPLPAFRREGAETRSC
ncbi:hypothetical protein EUGRSUZ_F03476 [Eucalyptus grandis]|uniref:Uncharacterized protein n=2 Tax=Eucalyptus grandis TaxID=71139 RepID=A0ACC3KLE6_EUCGR|nr:hypothetical protein EUGRSUZ_F03476 [Eucalyptus grandis]